MTRIREEAIEKVTGKTKYTVDFHLPGMAFAKILTSPYAHAKIASINTAAAEGLPGTLAVVTAEDFQNLAPYYGDVVKDEPVLATDKVRYQGEPVAAVAAVDLAAAEEAVALIEVEYEPLPVITTIESAIASDATLIHDVLPTDAPEFMIKGTNITSHTPYENGDIARGFAEADEIFEDEFHFPRVYHYPMEPATAIADVSADGVTVWTPTQGVFTTQERISEVFKLPLNRVRVASSYIGTGFGSRVARHEFVAVALAQKAGVPVKLVYSFGEDMATVARPGFHTKLRTGVKKDGTLIARQLETWVDGGGYARRSPWIAEMGLARFLAGYRCPNIKVDAYSVYTNKTPCTTYRAPGATQLGWARETQFDKIAEKLDMTPVEFRRKNLLRHGEEGAEKGTRPMDADLLGDLEKISTAINWGDPMIPGRGKGIAVGVSAAAAAPPSSAIAKLRDDGSLIVISSAIEMGQGIYTAMRQIAAWELGIPLAQVKVATQVDTTNTPYDPNTGGSRGTVMTGLAVQAAVKDVKDQIIRMAAKQLQVNEDIVEIKDSVVVAGEKVYTIAEVIHQYFTHKVVQPWAPGIISLMSGVSRSTHPTGRGEIIGRAVIAPEFDNGRLDRKPGFWESGMGAAEVEVDQETGRVKIIRYVGLSDVGKAFDEQTAKGQIEGAAMQGLGHTLGEAMAYDSEGQLLNNTLLEYRPTMMEDTPDEFQALIVENGDGVGAFGSKGMGQINAACTAPAVTTAIARATGVYMNELPITPYKLWEALQGKPNKTMGTP